jgi:serine/threonine protein kinase
MKESSHENTLHRDGGSGDRGNGSSVNSATRIPRPSTAKRVALLQTLVLISMAFLQQKLGAEAATALQSVDPVAPASPSTSASTSDQDWEVTYDDELDNPEGAGESAYSPTIVKDTASSEQEENEIEDEGMPNNNIQIDNLEDLVDSEVHPETMVEDTTSFDEEQEEGEDEDQDDGIVDVIIVATVDGTLAGLDRRNGKLIWKRSGNGKEDGVYTSMNKNNLHHRQQFPAVPETDALSEAPPALLEPLVSTTTTVQKASVNDWRTSAVPSTDGSVYLTAAGRETPGVPTTGRATTTATPNMDHEQDVTVTTTLHELVSRTPFVDTRGRIYTGSRHATAVAVDADTGEILETVAADRHSPAHTERPTLKDRNVVWMGRVDYSVSIHEPRSGSLDVQFSSSEIMSVNDMVIGRSENQPWERGAADHSHLLPKPNNGGADHRFGALPPLIPEKDFMLVATPNGDVAYRNPDTGQIDWVSEECFDTPVAFAVDSASGASLGVNLVPDAIIPNGSAEYISNEIERQLELSSAAETIDDDGGSDDQHDQTIVGSLSSGQLYAMPLGRKKSVDHSAAGMSPPRHAITASSLTALASSKHPHMANMGPAHITGRQHSHFHHAQHHPDGNKHHATSGKKSCSPGTNHNFPACLVGMRGVFARDPRGHFLSETAPSLEENAVVPFYHPEFGYIPNLDQAYFGAGGGQGGGEGNRSKSDKILRILGSWFFPTIALIFVVSFEMGRRKREKDKRQKDELDSNDIVQTVGGSESSRTTDVGVIHVCDDVILGYGGHGTVVYKGTLEGRQVAVKRMLKAYHASADREISLLIESDGHPNVVRYFLKEARGDFVYLALELCDLSLHDLIGTLRQHMEQNGNKENRLPDVLVSPVTKMVLFQIASGVKHLHHLRIVHRDLKPANILLADSRKPSRKRKETQNESPYETFIRGDFIAKISDMGLGKQLVGQSSFGASTLADISHNGQSHGQQSSIAGAGPGSVGWQAPEVMALRLPSDVSIRSDGSNPLQDSFPEVSPIDGVPNGRTSRSSDIFSLGCIFYSTLVPGSHPFGEWYEREANIMHNRPNLEALRDLSLEAYDLVSAMIQRNPTTRPTANQICEHPVFWLAERRLAFLCEFSDRLETEALNAAGDDASLFTNKLLAVERNAARVVGIAWDRDLDDDLTNNVQRFRTYDPSSVRDLLRLIRNKHHHFDELPAAMKEKIGSSTEGMIAYFRTRFPGLLIHCVNVCRELLPTDDPLCAKFSIAPIVRQITRRLEKHRSIVAAGSTGTEPTVVKIEKQCLANDVTKEAKAGQGTICQHENAEASNGNADSSARLEYTSTDLGDIQSHNVAKADWQPDASVISIDHDVVSTTDTDEVVIWEGSAAAKSFNCRGWSRSDDDWMRCTDLTLRKRDVNLVKCAEDAKFRTRLCNHWDVSLGTSCPMRKKNKCIFAHGPIELRVKEAKRHRWGKLVDQNGDNKNPSHSGGEDTYGAARSIETMRKEEGKWKTNKGGPNKGKKSTPSKKN